MGTQRADQLREQRRIHSRGVAHAVVAALTALRLGTSVLAGCGAALASAPGSDVAEGSATEADAVLLISTPPTAALTLNSTTCTRRAYGVCAALV